MKQTKVCCICGNDNKTVNTDKARLNGELKLFGKYKSKILNNEIS